MVVTESKTHDYRHTAVYAWVIMLLVSMLPNALWFELVQGDTRWMLWVKVALLAGAAALTFTWQAIHPLRNFSLIMLAIFLSEELISRLTATGLWHSWFGGASVPFTTSMLGTQLSRLGVALIMIGVLFTLGYRRRELFLVRGKLDAPIEPVRWLGFPESCPWTRFGGQFAIYISLGLLVFLMLAGRPSWATFLKALPMLPAVLVFAMLNAFNEEVTYRSSMLAGLEKAIGPRHALWNSALFFGIGHYFGVPYGVIGVLMSTFLGWFLGKAMLETRGFFWAWFIHFLQDVWIFIFLAMGSVTPGG